MEKVDEKARRERRPIISGSEAHVHGTRSYVLLFNRVQLIHWVGAMLPLQRDFNTCAVSRKFSPSIEIVFYRWLHGHCLAHHGE